MRLTWQYGKINHGVYAVQWTHWVEHGVGYSRYMIWNINSKFILLDRTVPDV